LSLDFAAEWIHAESPLRIWRRAFERRVRSTYAMGDTKTSYVDVRDVAQVAGKTLTTEGHAGRFMN